MNTFLKYLMLTIPFMGVVPCDWNTPSYGCREDAVYYFGNICYGNTSVDTLPGTRFKYETIGELPSCKRFVALNNCIPQKTAVFADSPILCKAGDTIPANTDLTSEFVWGKECEYITFMTDGFWIEKDGGALQKGLVTFTYEIYFDETDRTFSGERKLFVPDSLGF